MLKAARSLDYAREHEQVRGLHRLLRPVATEGQPRRGCLNCTSLRNDAWLMDTRLSHQPPELAGMRGLHRGERVQ